MKKIRDGFLPIYQRKNEGKTFEVVGRGDAVNVLIVKPGHRRDFDTFYFASQYRAGPHMKIYGNVAGMIDGGETPIEAAAREALEEAGAEGWLLYTGLSCFNSPGDSTTKTHFFVLFVEEWTYPTDAEEGVTMHGATYKQMQKLMVKGLSLPCVASLMRYQDRRNDWVTYYNQACGK